ncbi:putative GMC-type oxidoreductase-like protein [Dinothrombium tinctorium]|uniref:Putative GMC-type oxidoreductase-like protein n=1 Tax=Dinothrombium tinctorium TaxID=1965070 RepID=A0A3S3PX45_9ACAR|nr:putative GMC-type oxidoreductase-like protein [Dinothrombium tinctorium]
MISSLKEFDFKIYLAVGQDIRDNIIYNHIAKIPMLAPTLQGTEYDWSLKTITQNQSNWGLELRQSNWPRGRLLGGSNAINFMVHSWGAADDWINSSYGLNWEIMKKYLQKIEACISCNQKRGKSGPLTVTKFDVENSPLAKAFIAALKKKNFSTEDYNSSEGDHVSGPVFSNIRGGKRVTNFDAFIGSRQEEMSNVEIIKNAHVKRILISKFNKTFAKVIALEVIINKVKYTIWCKKEIILSAGVVGTPRILLQSGIGDSDILKNLNIAPVLHLPLVGKNLKDQMQIPIYFYSNNSDIHLNLKRISSVATVWNYFIRSKGPLATNAVELVIRNKNHHYMLYNMATISKYPFAKVANIRDGIFEKIFPQTFSSPFKSGFIILASCLKPKSVGFVSIIRKSTEEDDEHEFEPIIDPQYLTERFDVKCLRNAVIDMINFVQNSSHLKKCCNATAYLPPFDHCQLKNDTFNFSLSNRRYLNCWIRTAAMTAYHPTGTTSVDVLQPDFKVKTLSNLRIVDASVLETPISGPLNAPLTALAAYASQVILSDYKTVYN